ncbi:MAG TPA: TIGR04255 family protein [Thermoanaerobaculia bacterium]|nr:TIGR04255 family protein [Thermoanaerobaculia bacterium]
MEAKEEDIFSRPAPDENGVRRHFLRHMVCELRFPILLELAEQAPAKFQKAIRAEFPHFERKWDITVDPATPSPVYETRYVFGSRDLKWSLTLKPSSLSLETLAYTRFSEFWRQLKTAFSHARRELDIPFLTRVGVRYINAIPIAGELPPGWINADLVRPFEQRSFRAISLYRQEIRGLASFGSFSLRHGLEPPHNTAYTVDLDHYAESVELDSLETNVRALRDEANKLFFWVIGPKSLAYMREESEDRP